MKLIEYISEFHKEQFSLEEFESQKGYVKQQFTKSLSSYPYKFAFGDLNEMLSENMFTAEEKLAALDDVGYEELLQHSR